MPARTAKRNPKSKTSVVRKLEHDTDKKLKGGKRRYVTYDDEGRIVQSEYLMGDEVEKLDEPDTITVTITAP